MFLLESWRFRLFVFSLIFRNCGHRTEGQRLNRAPRWLFGFAESLPRALIWKDLVTSSLPRITKIGLAPDRLAQIITVTPFSNGRISSLLARFMSSKRRTIFKSRRRTIQRTWITKLARITPPGHRPCHASGRRPEPESRLNVLCGAPYMRLYI